MEKVDFSEVHVHRHAGSLISVTWSSDIPNSRILDAELRTRRLTPGAASQAPENGGQS
jgi:hypothetical protein